MSTLIDNAMRCLSCGSENRPDASFCLACGTKLAQSCSHCGRELPPSARFCDGCGQPIGPARAGHEAPGSSAVDPAAPDPRSYTPKHLAEKILTTRAALEGERKQVTVLFADVAGSTSIAERLDPEEVHEVMDGCFRILLGEVHRYEGNVNQFTGDGIMALFGAPIAHEDAPERAIRAALDMQRELQRYGDELSRQRGIDFKMRVGINSGPVVVGKIGDDLRMDYTAVGDTTNLAARLQTAAAPGTVVISEQTAKLVTGRFVTQPLGPLLLKGKSEPVAAHVVVRALPRIPLVAPSERGLTPLVGRATELTTLETIFNHVRGGSGQVVFVVGEAGIGKSRLLYELHRRLGSEAVTWLQGRCISFGRTIPFLPLIDVLKGGFGIDESDDDAAIIDKVREGAARLGPEMEPGVPYLRALLAVAPGDPEVERLDARARHFATFDALKRFLLASAAKQPLIILVEDLHWIDPASQECLTYLVDAAARARVLLLCTYRPGYQPVIADRSYLHRLTLQPLSPADTEAMAAAMLEAQAFPAEIRKLIVDKAEGNPFFIEEVTKSLLELGALTRKAEGYALARPLAEIVIPDTIHDVIMARIDRLGDEPKRAIQVASVIGREFAVRLLQRAAELGDRVDGLVGELRALELIYEKFGVPELAYMFKHALTHDVAYESLLVQRRKHLHRMIGRAIEELYGDRLSDHWETLAHHFYRGEEWGRAFDYLVKAADKALAAYANAEACAAIDRALEVGTHLGIDEAQTAALLERRGRALFGVSDFPGAIHAYREALTGAPAAARARLHIALADALVLGHELDAAVVAAGEAQRLAEPVEASAVGGMASFIVGFVSLVRGNLEDAARAFTDGSRAAQASHDSGLAAMTDAYMALMANWRGDYDAAVTALRPIPDSFRRANALLQAAESSSHLAIALAGAGRYAEALAVLAESIALAESIGEKFWRARMWNTRGWILGELGAREAATEANQRCLDLADQLGSLCLAPELVGNATLNLADVALVAGDAPVVVPYLERVGALLADRRNEWMTWRYGMRHHLAAAELALAHGESARAREEIEAGLVTARRTRSRRYIVRGLRVLAAGSAAEGNYWDAERLLLQSVSEARALGNPPQLWHSCLAYGRVLDRLGRRDEAIAAWREGRNLIRTVAAALPVDLRQSLLASPVSACLGALG